MSTIYYVVDKPAKRATITAIVDDSMKLFIAYEKEEIVDLIKQVFPEKHNFEWIELSDEEWGKKYRP